MTHSSGVSDGNAQGKTSGILTFSVPYNAPDTLYYQCQYHSGMYGIFNIVNGSTLPTASDSTLGGIKVGTNLSIDSNGVLSATDTNTTYIVGNGGLTENNFTNDLKSKLVGIATNADVTNENNAATATKLATARTIGGVSFDGSANINLPGVNAVGNQNTTGSAATLTTARTIGVCVF